MLCLSQTMSHVVVAISEKWDTWRYKNYIYCIALCYVYYFAFSGMVTTEGTPVSTEPTGTTPSLFRLFCCFVCSFTFYCMNQFSWNCLLPNARATNSSLAAFRWHIFIEVSSFVVAVYLTRYISREYCWIRAKNASFVADVVTFCRCHWCKKRNLTIQN